MRLILVVALVLVLLLVAVIPAVLVRDWYGGQLERLDLGPVPGDIGIDVYWVGGDQMVYPGLEEYVAAVVAAEMPARFHLEALKAQAIAARTYAVRRMRAFGGPGSSTYPGADVSSDPTLDQAWSSPQELREKWGLMGYVMHWRRITGAVEATRGLILVYDGEPADTVYHSTSGGQTESADLVWSVSVPYLVGVDSPYEDHSPHWQSSRTISLEQLARALDLDAGLTRPADDGLVEVLKTSPSGRALTVRVGEATFTGVELRSRLDLSSTLITSVTAGESDVTFHTRGYGHGVGMSQYGADGMARAGASCEEILQHYYPGTRIRPMFSE